MSGSPASSNSSSSSVCGAESSRLIKTECAEAGRSADDFSASVALGHACEMACVEAQRMDRESNMNTNPNASAMLKTGTEMEIVPGFGQGSVATDAGVQHEPSPASISPLLSQQTELAPVRVQESSAVDAPATRQRLQTNPPRDNNDNFPTQFQPHPQELLLQQQPFLARTIQSVTRRLTRRSSSEQALATQPPTTPPTQHTNTTPSKCRPKRRESDREKLLEEKSKKLLVLLEPFEGDSDQQERIMTPSPLMSAGSPLMSERHLVGDGGDAYSHLTLLDADQPDNDEVVVVDCTASRMLDEKGAFSPLKLDDSAVYALDSGACKSRAGCADTVSRLKSNHVYVCPICWENRREAELVIAGECAHSFCYYCMEEWVQKSSKCPVWLYVVLNTSHTSFFPDEQYCRHKIDVKPLKTRIAKAKIATVASKMVSKSCAVFNGMGSKSVAADEGASTLTNARPRIVSWLRWIGRRT
ncbi:hypothetical protein BC830DRAFT_1155943 [Chytriomyces sp. MP71]|nr:hypothetical protein BC830DRAFT_1155943 [Chytriomyces sp. MP71]